MNNPNCQMILHELTIKMDEYEKIIHNEVKSIMESNNYVRFYKFNNNYVFQDQDGNIIPSDYDTEMMCKEYYDLLRKDDIDITL